MCDYSALYPDQQDNLNVKGRIDKEIQQKNNYRLSLENIQN